MENPFKFGLVVSDDYFTDREVESAKLSQIIASANHVIMIAPQRFGKTSLVNKVVAKELNKNNLKTTNYVISF